MLEGSEKSEYSRNYLSPEIQARISPTPKHTAGVSSASTTASEPSFTRKRKEENHELKRTFTTDHVQHEDLPNADDDDSALKYRAGYRRVQFSMPTQYQLQYCRRNNPQVPSKQSPVVQAVRSRPSSSPAHAPPSGLVCAMKRSSPAKHRSPLTKLKEMECQNGSPSLQQQDISNGCGSVQSASGKNVQKMQHQFENRMSRVGHNKEQQGLCQGIPERDNQPHNQPRVVQDQRDQPCITQDQRDQPRVIQDHHQHQETHKKAKHRRSTTYPLVTEYQAQFGKRIHTHHHHSNYIEGIDELKQDVEPSASKESTYFTPSTCRSEYASNYVSPMQLQYLNGVWVGAPHTDLFLHPPTPPRSNLPQTTLQQLKEHQNPSPTASWFNQVLELREKVKNFKERGRGSDIKAEILMRPASMGTSSTGTSSLSVTSSTSSGGVVNNDMMVEDIEGSTESLYGSSDEGERKFDILPDRETGTHDQPPSLSARETSPRQEHVATPSLRGRVPTPELAIHQQVNPSINRHHLDMTTPTKGPGLTSERPRAASTGDSKGQTLQPRGHKGHRGQSSNNRPLITKTVPSITSRAIAPVAPVTSTRPLVTRATKPPVNTEVRTLPPKSTSRATQTPPGSSQTPLSSFQTPQRSHISPGSSKGSSQIPQRSSRIPPGSSKGSSQIPQGFSKIPHGSPLEVPRLNITRSDTSSDPPVITPCVTCGARPKALSYSVVPSSVLDCKICRSARHSSKALPKHSYNLKNSITAPVLQPRSVDHTPKLNCTPKFDHTQSYKDSDRFSLSSMSSCSLASDILERAQHRRDNFWHS